MTERLHFHFSLSCIGEGNGNPLQCSCLENPRDGGAWWAAVHGVAQSRTRLKRLSSSSSSVSLDLHNGHFKSLKIWLRILEFSCRILITDIIKRFPKLFGHMLFFLAALAECLLRTNYFARLLILSSPQPSGMFINSLA